MSATTETPATDPGSVPASAPGKGTGKAPGILTFAVDGRPRANRTKNTKTRSGCVTCKKRRIRCDEAKPSCLNCAKSKRTCEGYVQKPAATDLPKFLGERRTILIKPNYEANLFTDQLQKDHFHYWLNFTKEFTLFPTDLMSHMMPQIARDEPAIRHAAFAIGAATMVNHSRQDRTSGNGKFTEEAYKHYGKAIQIIRHGDQSRRSIPRALLSCLLFVTFESLQGNHKAALQHMNHGCNMLDQVIKQGISGECPPKLVEEVQAGFRRFTLLSWSLDGFHPPETEAYVPWCCRGRRSRYAIDEMPPAFNDLREAQKWWEITQHHVIYKSGIKSGFAFEGLQRDNPHPMTQITAETSKKYLDIMEKWQVRFKPLIKDAVRQRASNPQKYLQMSSLRLYYLSLDLGFKSMYYHDLDYLADSTPAFKTIVSLCKIVMSGQHHGPDVEKEVFTVESSPTWPLMIVGVFCADPEVRKDVNQLMREYPRRDGIWDSRAFDAILRSTEALREASAAHIEVCRSILDNKQLIFGEDGVRRRTYEPSAQDGTWRVTLEQSTPLDVGQESQFVLR
ncbi:C6 zinc finger domain protein [Colletotrichum asianum]|uniref:C6 zinc finger domain protein n=1 Tax=Colletotrichum asianum TaxID=702518 RepID=A0A8H3WEZ4_9PEZI|nr:C6 zinc finger domain protein [Colletotrichum asianum]